MKIVPYAVLLVMLLTALLSGGDQKTPESGSEMRHFTSVEYDVISTMDLSEEIQDYIEANKRSEFTKVFDTKEGNQVVVIGLGERPTGGYDVIIDTVEYVDGSVYIWYGEQKPDKDEFVIQALTYPVKAIEIQSDLPVELIKLAHTPTDKQLED